MSHYRAFLDISGQNNRQLQLAPNDLTSVSPVEEYVARKEELRPWDAGFPSEYSQEIITNTS